MPFDRFLIAPLNSGLETNLKPFLIPDDAFVQLNNAYVFRGRVRKRFGSFLLNGAVDPDFAQLNSRLRINLGNTAPITGNFGPIVVPGVIWKVGQIFAVDNDIFPGSTIFTVISNVPGLQPMLTTGGATGRFDTATGTLQIVGNNFNPNTPVYFYPTEPVMGLITYETAPINDEETYAFDTQFAYQFTAGGWERLGVAIWTGNNSQFFWGTTWRGVASNNDILFISNFNVPDVIKYWNGAIWTNFNPLYNAAQTIRTARIIIPYHDRLVFLNTIETVGGVNTQFRNRCRFSQNGSPLDVDAWREDMPGRGGFIDCATKEGIISAQFVRDRLIVFFEKSTWELAYTGNEILPFIWQQINTELGAESTFSIVPFDKFIIGIGDVGVHLCNGTNVDRIDDKIPDTVFEIHNGNDGPARVYGVRDYFTELIYWAFPDRNIHPLGDPVFPNRILVYNYKNGSWAFNDDSITCFGYFQNVNDIRWNTSNSTWQETITTWGSGSLQSQFRQIIAGNQEGFTFIVDSGSARNAPALQITNMAIAGNLITLTIIDHNLNVGDYIIIESAQGIIDLNENIYQVNTVPDLNTITVIQDFVVGVYEGGGTAARISQIDILTKQYNFYQNQGRNAYISKVDFMVNRTVLGQITIDYFPSSSNLSMVTQGQATGSILGSSILETSPYLLNPLEVTQTRVWHPVYLQTEGETIQLRLYFSDAQMRDVDIVWSDFQLNAILFYAMPTTFRLQ